MAYEIIYTGAFDSTAERGYSVEILKKDYEGDIIPLTLAGVPVIHQWHLFQK
jgi:hypothetical protein